MVKKVKGKVPTPKMKGQASRPTRPHIPVEKKKELPKTPASSDTEMGIIDDIIL